MLKISWPRTESSGWSDHIPTDLFSTEGKKLKLTHQVIGPKNRPLRATFDLLVSGNIAEFDYEAHRATNEKADVFVGIMKVKFRDDTRREISEVLWKERGSKEIKGEFYLEDYDIAALEGKKKLATHLRSERQTSVANAKKQSVLAEIGHLVCEGCGRNLSLEYKSLGSACYEVHHLKPIAAGVQKPTLKDLAILCANCHRVLHSINPLPKTIKAFKRSAIA